MIEFGKTLRLARESKGYTISQVAEMTRMIHQTIEDLENENFTRIAAPIYGRGFVKLYCEAVGLDAKPMVAEFMEIFSGNRNLGIKERAPSPPAVTAGAGEKPAAEPVEVPSPAEIPEPVAPEPPSKPAITSFQPELGPVTAESMPPVRESESAPSPSEPKLSRYASPLREASLPTIPRSVWRIAALGAGALLILWLLGLGFKALYKATSGAEPVSTAGETAPPENIPRPEKDETPPTSEMNVNRAKVDVPPLYVD